MNELRGRSLYDFYHDVCAEMKITPNSIFSKMLPKNSGEVRRDDVIDFTINYVGDRGMIAIIKVIAVGFPNLRVLRLKNNGLRNKAVIEISERMAHHSNIEEIDLSNNYISTGAGKALEKLLKENHRIRIVNIDGTKIDADIRIRIQDTLRERN